MQLNDSMLSVHAVHRDAFLRHPHGDEIRKSHVGVPISAQSVIRWALKASSAAARGGQSPGSGVQPHVCIHFTWQSQHGLRRPLGDEDAVNLAGSQVGVRQQTALGVLSAVKQPNGAQCAQGCASFPPRRQTNSSDPFESNLSVCQWYLVADCAHCHSAGWYLPEAG